MTTAASPALCAAMPLPASAEVPDWVHLLPAQGGAVQTTDGRGPYRLADAAAVIAASMATPERLVVDENHATDLASPKGGAAPARGWITALQARDDGIWAAVEWTGAGRALLADRAYRGVSPVILHRKDGTIDRILRASLTNTPNLKGQVTLNSEDPMDKIMAAIAKAVGLDEGADGEAILAAIRKMKHVPDSATALQSALGEVATILGTTADPAAITAAAKAAKSGADGIVALQAEVTSLTEKLNAVTAATARAKAEAFVDGAIRAGRAGVKPLRDHYVTMHMADPARVEKEIGAMPVLGGGTVLAAPAADGPIVSLNAEQLAVATALGLTTEAYLKTLNAEKGVAA